MTRDTLNEISQEDELERRRDGHAEERNTTAAELITALSTITGKLISIAAPATTVHHDAASPPGEQFVGFGRSVESVRSRRDVIRTRFSVLGVHLASVDDPHQPLFVFDNTGSLSRAQS